MTITTYTPFTSKHVLKLFYQTQFEIAFLIEAAYTDVCQLQI